MNDSRQPPPTRRARRDPRIESTPPPAEERTDVHRPRPEMGSRPSFAGPPPPADLMAAQVGELENELARLREANERDAALVGQMLVRVSDREQALKQARAETVEQIARADDLARRLAALEAGTPAAKTEEAAAKSADDFRARIEALEAKLVETEARERAAQAKLDSIAAAGAEVNSERESFELNATDARRREEAWIERGAHLEAEIAAAAKREASWVERSAHLESELAQAAKREEAWVERGSHLESELAARDAKLEAAEKRAEAVAAELEAARKAADEATQEVARVRAAGAKATVRVGELEASVGEKSRELAKRATDQKAAEATLRKKHEQSLAEQKAMFERQLSSVEKQLGEAKVTRDEAQQNADGALQALTAATAERTSLGARLADALESGATAARDLESSTAALARAMGEIESLATARTEAESRAARLEAALTQIEDIDRDASARKTSALLAARSAATGRPATLPAGAPPPAGRVSAIPAPVPSRSVAPKAELGTIPEESFESLNVESLFSEPPPEGEERHSIPAFSRNITPKPAPHPLSDSEIQVSVDEDDTF